MKRFMGIAGAIAVVLTALPTYGFICSGNSVTIDFTNPADATAKASWLEYENLGITQQGLGWEGEPNAIHDGWFITHPIATGLSWRPTRGASVKVTIQTTYTEEDTESENPPQASFGSLYARYSPDAVHWSTWHEMNRLIPEGRNKDHFAVREFDGDISVPKIERIGYDDLLSEYGHLDVPWSSDEEGAVRWIVANQPDYFAHNLPFVGYVQFLYEQGLTRNVRITFFEAHILFSMGGLASVPQDDKARAKHMDAATPWAYCADERIQCIR